MGPAHRPGTGGARRRRRVAAGQRGDRDRTAGSGGRVRGPTRAPAQRISGRAQPRRRTAERGNGRHRRRRGPTVLGAHQAPATGGGAEPAHRPGRHRRPGGGLPMNRILAAARLHLVHPLVILGVPWLIVLSSFALNWAIWAVAGLGSEPGAGFTGGILSLYITVLVVFVQSVTQLLPFAMGVSLSRRAFFLGTAFLGGVQALGYGVTLAVLSAIEYATDGWGVGMSFWTPGPLKVDNLLLQVVVSGASDARLHLRRRGDRRRLQAMGLQRHLGADRARHAGSRWRERPGDVVAGLGRPLGVAVRSSGRHPGDRLTRGPRRGCGRTRLRGDASRRPLTPATPTSRAFGRKPRLRVPFRGGARCTDR